MTYTTDDTTKASAPGQIEISKTKYLNFRNLTGFKRIKYALLFSLPEKVLFRLFKSDNLVFDFIQKKEQFKWIVIDQIRTIDKTRIIKNFGSLADDEIILYKQVLRETFVD